MVQMSLEGLEKVNIDFSDPILPESVKITRPLLFRVGNLFCCVLGPDPKRGILGCGNTEASALKDFDFHLQELRKNYAADDEVALFVESAYAAHNPEPDANSDL